MRRRLTMWRDRPGADASCDFAMMPSCSCFARRVKLTSVKRKSLIRHAPATVHGVVFAVFVWSGPSEERPLRALRLPVHVVHHEAHAFLGHLDPVAALQGALGVLVAA